MFVKVIRYNKSIEDGETHIKDTVTSIYQCGTVKFRLVDGRAVSKITDGDVPMYDLMIEMEGCPAPHNDFLAVQCERKQLSVFIMNDAGKTIDSYVYN